MRQSESARMTTAHEAAFRVQYPNSTPRSIKVIALDPEAGKVVAELSAKSWNRAIFFSALTFPAVGTPAPAADQALPVASARQPGAHQDGTSPPANTTLQAWLKDVAGHATELVAEIDSADIVVVVASPGTDAHAASIIGNACRLRHKSMIGLILKTAGVSDQQLSRTLLGMRPLATMLVVASGTEYVEEMLHAMRA